MTGDEDLNFQLMPHGGYGNLLLAQSPIRQEQLEFLFIWLKILIGF